MGPPLFGHREEEEGDRLHLHRGVEGDCLHLQCEVANGCCTCFVLRIRASKLDPLENLQKDKVLFQMDIYLTQITKLFSGGQTG